MRNRSFFFLDFLRRKIKDLEKKLAADLRGRPVIVSGMASSTIGIKNLPYSELPQRLDAPDIRHEIFPADTSFPHDLLLISGICADEDVMRGEETQLIGLHREYGFTEALCILPGTHSKHLKIEKGELTGFKTYMTGELFQLLGTHSILRGSLSTGNEEPDLKSFYRGVDRGRSGNLLHTLFTIRARGLVGHREAESARDFLSGLLIGMELAELLPFSGEEVIVAGNGRLQEYYSCALRHFGVPHKADRNPDHRTLQGHLALLNLFC